MIDRPGVWCRAATSATITGLDLVQAMASLPDGLDRDLARRLFIAAETPFLAGRRDTHKTKD